MTTSSLEARLAQLEGFVEELRVLLASIENRLDRLEDRVNALEARMQSNFQWMVGIMVGVLLPMWASIILAVLLKG